MADAPFRKPTLPELDALAYCWLEVGGKRTNVAMIYYEFVTR